jgi:hypothetical protein
VYQIIRTGENKATHPAIFTSNAGVGLLSNPGKVELPISSEFQMRINPIISNIAMRTAAKTPPEKPAQIMSAAAMQPGIIFFQEKFIMGQR